MWGLKNRMVFDSPKVLALAKGRGGWVKTICDAMDYFLLAVEEDRIDSKKQ